jgi:hypothetical protein
MQIWCYFSHKIFFFRVWKFDVIWLYRDVWDRQLYLSSLHEVFKYGVKSTRPFKVSKSDTILSLQETPGFVILINIDERQKFGSFCVPSEFFTYGVSIATPLKWIDFGRIVFSVTASHF